MACKLLTTGEDGNLGGKKNFELIPIKKGDLQKVITLQPGEIPYFSAEFQLKNPGIFYHFRLRKNTSEAMFGLIKKGSRVLESIKPGDTLPIIYHFQDKTIPSEKRTTRIKYIEDGMTNGFKDHFLIALDITAEINTDK